jgi:hypothetical protein
MLSPLTASGRQQGGASVQGRVTDERGGLLVGASVALVDSAGREQTFRTDGEGNYRFGDLAPGKYTLRVAATNFAPAEAELSVSPGARVSRDVNLGVALEKTEEVTIASEPPVSIENRGGGVTLRDEELEALPDDPDELASALQSLAGPSFGPDGGQITIDGFEGARLPPRSSIREVRLSDNPLIAERDLPGFGGIQILTRPGTDKLRGSTYLGFMDESFNARNPFAERRADFQFRQYGGSLSGPIVPQRTSFFVDAEHNQTDDNDIVNATVLDAATLQPSRFVTTVLTPMRRTYVGPRFDYQINPDHTLIARYSYFRNAQENLGVSTFSLPERAYDQTFQTHTVQLTETAVLSKTAVNEIRFQYVRNRRDLKALNDEHAVNVLDAFMGGGAQVGNSFFEDDRFELTNITTFARGNHTIRFGGRLRAVRVTDFSENNFGGTYIFAGGLAPSLSFDAGGNPVAGEQITVTSLERFRRTLDLQRRGLSPEQVIALGGGPTQLALSGGDPEAGVSQVDFGGFIQEDWKARPNLTLGLGLRYETQSNITSRFNFAPRLFISWAPDYRNNRPAKTVIHAGFGMFYERASENLTLQSLRFDGLAQQRFITADPQVLALFPVVPSAELLAGPLAQAVTRLDPGLQAPYSYTSGLILERQLPARFTLTTYVLTYDTRHLLRSRNVNAPLPGSLTPESPGGIRPDPTRGDVYQFESSGKQKMRQFNVGIRNQFSRTLSLFASYGLMKVRNDSDGPFSFPADSYDLRSEYGAASFDVRHRFNLGGSVEVPRLKLTLSPIVVASSGRPFNIITGSDNNGDGIFNDRPAFADGATPERDLARTPFGDFDLKPKPGQTIIPRNFGRGPSFFSVNVRVSRQFGFGHVNAPAAATGGPAQGGQRSRAPEAKPYSVTLSLFFYNLLNHANLNTPVGNLSSQLFGQSLSTVGSFGGGGNPAAGNRRVQASVRFNF